MMKTLIILAHPNINDSKVNKRWREELLRHSDEITVHELYKEYPDWKIDVEQEQQMLESYDTVIFQFPLYWYNCPPLFKKWMDDVFTYGWAYGSKGKKLKGKKIGVAISIGSKEDEYQPTGLISYTVDEIITPFKATVKYVGATILPHFAVFGTAFQLSDEEIHRSAKEYMDYIRQLH